jgi:hypothetical protein
MPVWTRLPLASSSVLLANRRGLQTLLGRSRIATFERLFEGTDENSLGQTSPGGALPVADRFTTTTAVTQFRDP